MNEREARRLSRSDAIKVLAEHGGKGAMLLSSGPDMSYDEADKRRKSPPPRLAKLPFFVRCALGR